MNTNAALRTGAALSARDAVPVAISVAARAAFIAFKGFDSYSVDLAAWAHVGNLMAQRQNPYLASPKFLLWPPVWVQILFVLERVSRFLGVSLFRTVPIFLIAVETVLMIVLLRLLRELGYPQPKARTLVLVGIALNPVCIILVCQHGNFDVLVALCILLGVGWLIRFQSSGASEDWLLACAALGAGVALKTAPVLLLPLLLAGVRRLSWRARFLGAGLAIGPTAYGLGVMYVLRAGSVGGILNYRSVSGWFGATGWLHRIGRSEWDAAYGHLSTLAFAVAGLLIAFLAYRGRLAAPARMVASAALLLAAVPGLGPGYGAQYFYWFWPLLLVTFALGPPRMRRLVAVFGAVAVPTYLVEYAFAPFLGAFLAMRFPATRGLVFGADTPDFGMFTLVRTPLWLCYLALLWGLAARDPGDSELRVGPAGRPGAAARLGSSRR